MKNDQGFDLSGLEKFEEEASPKGEEIFNESLRVVKDAMKNVVQEILLTLPDGSSHMVYVTGLEMSNNKTGELTVLFNTPSEDRKAELYPHVENCIKIQLQEHFQQKKKSWFR